VVGAGKGKSEMGLWYIWRNSEKTGVPSDVLRSSFCFPSVIMMSVRLVVACVLRPDCYCLCAWDVCIVDAVQLC